ncbi:MULTISPECIES: 3-methyl-2-oxobutanoate dehydrogenase subunit VorB [unclassified Pseudodesulfovibrio]|uniref:3-methyl-2-oxobutanoate dehydrogenase subunit VorB n=1 Tax=unclassified Pseudodesulfovibrio TaxID=2661612 RepID=UPI000FEBEB9D|nr:MULTISPECIES: 3-methyl-2-oxobutanoate dehydrogenase subunit VorB [unclassified Pseudodesulfovibrio]MCJ2165158.1 3-methyl-2-oxobutanoate dehydrogenase subunit VorB [Pseudodesulfovibrio sp. S3-i]RWU03390.1 3-methyl-2-oxobutanoate dehydrogenase subunit VorB [Pseudodesulfovibrio sp. S3]
MTKKAERIFVKGNEAIARGALAAKCKCFFGYPITPQNDIPEFMSSEMIKAGGDFVQAESEVAAANMLLGAGASGVRAMTSSSSPGMSLKQEAISYMAGSEIPAVIVNMNRGGPGLGDIGPAQGDYYQSTRGGGHGDYRHFTFGPGTVQEAYDLTIRAFDIAFEHRTPVLILGDAILGQMKEPITPWEPEDVDEEAGRDWAITGKTADREKRLVKSLFLQEGELAEQNKHLQAKYDSWIDLAEAEQFETEDAELVICAYGSIGRIAKSAVRKFRKQGKKVGLFRPITLYPYPSAELKALAEQGKRFLTIEHNLGQMLDDVRLAIRTIADSDFYPIYPGNLPTPDELEEPILKCLEGK